jgi:hypothetical protein
MTRNLTALVAGVVGLGLLWSVSSANCAEVAGSVTDNNTAPALPAHVSIADKTGKIVGAADADSNGHYSIGGIDTGEYNITLNLPGTKWLGQTIQTGIRPEGLCLDWKVSQTTNALATGRPGASLGTCTAAAFWGSGAAAGLLITGGAMGLGGIGVGIAAAAGAFNGGGGAPAPASPGI